MHIVPAVPVTMDMLRETSVPDSSYAPWAADATYAADTSVVRAVAQTIYEGVVMPTIFKAVVGHTGKDPAVPSNRSGYVAPDGTENVAGPWVELGAVPAWLPFDGQTGKLLESSASIRYSLLVPTLITGLFLFRLAATRVRARVIAASGDATYDRTIRSLDTRHMSDAWRYVSQAPIVLHTVAFDDIIAPAGSTVEVTISGAGTKRVGEIALGRAIYVGVLRPGPTVSYRDFTEVNRDNPFGRVKVLRRGYAETASLQVALDARRVEYVQGVLIDVRGRPAVFHGGADLTQHGTTLFGMATEPPFTVETFTHAEAQIEIESLS